MKRPKIPQNVITFTGIFALINLLEIVVMYVYFNANKEPILDFNTSIGIIALLLGIPALIISIITLVYAYFIRKNDIETKEKNIINSKNAFQYSLREFFVQFMLNMDNSQIITPINIIRITASNLLIYFRELKTDFKNHTLSDPSTSSLLTQIEIMLNNLTQIQNTTLKDYQRRIEEIKDRLNAIATKYDFQPLEV